MPTRRLPGEAALAGHPESHSALDVVRSLIGSVPPSAWLRESHVAQRLTGERRRKGWSQERLSREMKRHGFSLSQSSISKIENPPEGTVRRAVSLDEAIGLAVVFEMPLTLLLMPPSRYGTKAVEDLTNGANLAEHADEATQRFTDAVSRVGTEFADHPDDFGPILASEAARLCALAGLPFDSNESILSVDPLTLEPPARYQLVFIQAVIKMAERTKPRRRGPRKGQR